MTAGKDVIGILDSADQILEISRRRFAPDAIYVLQAYGPGHGHVPDGI